MKKYLLALIILAFFTLPAHSLDGDCDYTAGSTTTAKGFTNCDEEIAEAQKRGAVYTSSTNSGNAITSTSVPTGVATALRQGLQIIVDSPVTINGAATINYDGTGAKSVTDNANVALGSGGLVSGTRYLLNYNTAASGTWMVMNSVVAPGDSVTVNTTAVVNPDFDDAAPAAGAGGKNITWQTASNDISGYIAAGSTTVIGVNELADSGETETGTDTTRTVTPAGLLAAISGKQTIYVPAGAMISETTTGCATGTVESATSLVMYKTLDCDGGGALQEGAQFMVGMPKSWNESTLTFRIDWTAASGTGDVIWLLSCAAYSNDDALATANFGSEVSVTDTVLTALDLHQAPESGAVTAGGTPVEGDNLWCRIQRDGDAAGDTLDAVDARIIGVRALYTVNAFTDD